MDILKMSKIDLLVFKNRKKYFLFLSLYKSALLHCLFHSFFFIFIYLVRLYATNAVFTLLYV